jgi:uncharacterized membrane protein
MKLARAIINCGLILKNSFIAILIQCLIKKRSMKLKSKMVFMIVGVCLIVVALILGAVQHFGVYNIYGTESNKWYFYGPVGAVGLVGIVLAIWSLMKK